MNVRCAMCGLEMDLDESDPRCDEVQPLCTDCETELQHVDLEDRRRRAQTPSDEWAESEAEP